MILSMLGGLLGLLIIVFVVDSLADRSRHKAAQDRLDQYFGGDDL